MDLAQTDALSGRFSFVSKNTDLVLGIATISILLIMIIPIPTIGIIITIVNLLAGFAIGVFQKGLSFSEAAQTYTLLTAGDGLVSQIPALIISTAGGIVVSRAGAESNLGLEIGTDGLATRAGCRIRYAIDQGFMACRLCCMAHLVPKPID
jgi:flagellar biosynthesis component FlhA